MNEKQSVFSSAWILTDGKMGDLVQCRGVASALGIDPLEKIVAPQKPWVWFMPMGPLAPADRLGSDKSPIEPPFPDLVIASGWRTLAYVREIKRAAGDQVFTLFLKNPRIKTHYLDLVWLPEHDRVSGPRMISTLTGPHRYSPQLLASQFAQKPGYLEALPAPLVAVLLGGNSKDYSFSDSDIKRLSRALGLIAKAGAGLAITPSRRTPVELGEAIKERLEGLDHYWWDGKSDNPYGYLLAHADHFIVTAESANLMSEPCVTGKPISCFTPTGKARKLQWMQAKLRDYGALRPLIETRGKLDEWSYKPLYAADEIAQEVLTAMSKKQL